MDKITHKLIVKFLLQNFRIMGHENINYIFVSEIFGINLNFPHGVQFLIQLQFDVTEILVIYLAKFINSVHWISDFQTSNKITPNVAVNRMH